MQDRWSKKRIKKHTTGAPRSYDACIDDALRSGLRVIAMGRRKSDTPMKATRHGDWCLLWRNSMSKSAASGTGIQDSN